MFKIMMTTLDSGEEAFCVQEDFESEGEAWAGWNEMSDEWPEMTGMWVEKQSIVDEFGAEAAANVMGINDELGDYLLDDDTHL